MNRSEIRIRLGLIFNRSIIPFFQLSLETCGVSNAAIIRIHPVAIPLNMAHTASLLAEETLKDLIRSLPEWDRNERA
jgi:hypothetical protein